MKPTRRPVAENRLVALAMSRAVLEVGPDQTAGEARRLAGARGAQHLLVMDEGNLVGILCRCDLDGVSGGVPVSDRMSVPVMTIGPGATLREAENTMADCGVGCLPVVVGGLILGTVSRTDLERPGAHRLRPGTGCRCHRARAVDTHQTRAQPLRRGGLRRAQPPHNIP